MTLVSARMYQQSAPEVFRQIISLGQGLWHSHAEGHPLAAGAEFYGPDGMYPFAGHECARAFALISTDTADCNDNLEVPLFRFCGGTMLICLQSAVHMRCRHR